MLASAAIPGFFKMRKIGNENFVDGSLFAGFPAARRRRKQEEASFAPDPNLEVTERTSGPFRPAPQSLHR
jgi:predicted acylesterase/phospholipase RssA